jgi:hypothetical protein
MYGELQVSSPSAALPKINVTQNAMDRVLIAASLPQELAEPAH